MIPPDKKPQDEKKKSDFWRAYSRAAGILGIGWALAAGAIVYAVAFHDKEPARPAPDETRIETPQSPRP